MGKNAGTWGWLALLGLAGCEGGSPLTPDFVTPEELDQLGESGDVIAIDRVDALDDRTRRERLADDAEAVVEAYVADYPEAADKLLWTVDSPDAERLPDGNVQIVLPGSGRTVVLQGEGLERRSDAAVIESLDDPAYYTGLIDTLHEVVPNSCRSEVAANWASQGIDAQIDTFDALGRCWDEWSSFAQPFGTGRDYGGRRGESIDPERKDPGECTLTPVAGGGNDRWRDTGACIPDNPMASGYVYFDDLPPVSDQARRGTCVAFATASALEYSVKRTEEVTFNLSEQLIYSIGKWDIDGVHFGDGLATVPFLEDLADRGDHLDPEETWGYNPSGCRLQLDDDSYVDSCTNYGNGCSDTAHQLHVMQDINGQWYLWRPRSDDTQFVTVGDAEKIGGFFNPMDAHDFVRALLDSNSNWGAIASLTVTEDFRNAGSDGFLPDDDDTDVGGHAVHVVKFVSDSGARGGGWVVIKNSWGCDWGDQGFAYLSLGWFMDKVRSVSLVRARRTIVENTPPSIAITWPTEPGVLFLPLIDGGRSVALQAVASDAEHDDCCDIHWYSTQDGPLGTGDSITADLEGEGRREIRAVVQDRHGVVSEDSLIVELTNVAPDVSITRPTWTPAVGTRLGQAVPVGMTLTFGAEVDDPNKINTTLPCAQRRWSYSGPGVGGVAGGCLMTRTFDTPGWYRITHEAWDSLGATGSAVRYVRAVQWRASDPPFAVIDHPDAELSGFIWPPTDTMELRAAVHSATPLGATVRWFVDDVQIGTGETLQWQPSTMFPGNCGGYRPTLRMEATDANGTTVDEVPLFVYYPVC